VFAVESQDCNERFTVSAATLSYLGLGDEVLGHFIEGVALGFSRHLLWEATASNHSTVTLCNTEYIFIVCMTDV
jgi:hypothetical protein